ncbi:MAG: sigma-70 family RNA polymerase sigma factor [Planctomycetes bacterium]|nr:sigma-70 family RNA polymerase sigma factor [Planctomycetota bacterium]
MPHDRHELGPLLLRSRAGDSAARNGLLDHIRPFLKALIRSWIGPAMCGKLNDSDIVQETLLRIDQHLADFRGEETGRFLAWARTIAYRAAIDCSRKLDPVQHGSGPLHAAADPGLSPLETVEHADDVLQLLVALEQLPERRRAVLLGRFFEGLSTSQLAKRMGITEGNVRVLVLRGLKDLRTLLETDS